MFVRQGGREEEQCRQGGREEARYRCGKAGYMQDFTGRV